MAVKKGARLEMGSFSSCYTERSSFSRTGRINFKKQVFTNDIKSLKERKRTKTDICGLEVFTGDSTPLKEQKKAKTQVSEQVASNVELSQEKLIKATQMEPVFTNKISLKKDGQDCAPPYIINIAKAKRVKGSRVNFQAQTSQEILLSAAQIDPVLTNTMSLKEDAPDDRRPCIINVKPEAKLVNRIPKNVKVQTSLTNCNSPYLNELYLDHLKQWTDDGVPCNYPEARMSEIIEEMNLCESADTQCNARPCIINVAIPEAKQAKGTPENVQVQLSQTNSSQYLNNPYLDHLKQWTADGEPCSDPETRMSEIIEEIRRCEREYSSTPEEQCSRGSTKVSKLSECSADRVLNSTDVKKIKVDCPHCKKKVVAVAFVRHLSKCMGFHRRSTRTSRRRA